jgi:hypothetical protein
MDVFIVDTQKPQANGRFQCLHPKALGKWTFPSLTPESLRQKLKSLRRDENASGKTAFSVGNIKKPQAKRHFQLETSKYLRQNDISSEKQRFA